MLESLSAQTYQDWELVLVDSGGKDSTKALLKNFNGPFKHKVTAAGQSLGALLNIGLDSSESELVTVLDDDDTWSPDFLEKMIPPLDAGLGTTLGGVVCWSTCVRESQKAEGFWETVESFPLEEPFQDLTIYDLIVRNRFTIHAFVFLRSAQESVGRYDEHLVVAEDWDFNLRFLQKYDVYVVPELLANYHQRLSVPDGVSANTINSAISHHRMSAASLVNKHIREELNGQGTGLGMLMAQARMENSIMRRLQLFESRFLFASEKIGKIDARTKQMKDFLAKRMENQPGK
ncbi:MAG TPA: glycosyltransferase family 2 protein [Verrucomicrobiales bacterium]|nr:glycosyltransferase family 2 protein [Verrucomicrobiales bacterium]